ncbi:interleukin-22 receptor subunit alpha-1 [Elgaria multicarinata webbii]|uniref:interleukin-22 receptor subunit alpha-1 n=1 Tax=Elgaria multicarinata webbii TaxID=159646 RepID=UPI002FCD1948
MKVFFIYWVLCSLVGNLLAERSPLIQQAAFLSTNFENIFTWQSGKETLPGTVYDVQYKKYGDAWQNKSECQNITQRFCNLTQETENFTERYHARVRAIVHNCCVSDWAMSMRFCPREDTNIGKPEVKCTPSFQSIKFFIQPPYTPLRDEDNQTLTVVDVFNQFGTAVLYEITMFCQKTGQRWRKTETNREFEIPDLDPDTEYNGTIQIRYLDKISNPYVFRVWTSSDNTWLPYLFGVVLFMAVSMSGTIYYFIYKYVKQHAAQPPTSLDFKDIPLHFQPLTPNAEHILTSYSFSKSIQCVPEKRPAQLNQHLGELEHQKSFNLTGTAYQQQAKASLFRTLAQPVGQADDLPIGYAPQVVKCNPPGTVGDNPTTLIYGTCIDGTGCVNKASSPPNRAMKPDPSLEGSARNGCYKAQKPEQLERGLWENEAQQQPALVWEYAQQAQHPLLQEDMQNMPQQLPILLEERVAERTGSYRKQPGGLVLAPLEHGQNAISEGGPLSSAVPPSSFPPGACNSLSQDQGLGQWAAWESLAWTDNQRQPLGFPMTDCIAQVSKGLQCEPASLGTVPSTLDSAQNGLFTGLFRDLELKLQWDNGPDENAPIF